MCTCSRFEGFGVLYRQTLTTECFSAGNLLLLQYPDISTPGPGAALHVDCEPHMQVVC